MNISKSLILKSGILFALLFLFYIYYFKNVYDQYSERITSTSITETVADEIDPPTVTICFDDPWKSSIFEKYNINMEYFKGRSPDGSGL